MDTKRLGNFGERVACCYLEDKGYRILDRNYSRKWIQGPQKGEIDIVAKPRRSVFDALRGKKDNTVHFIEVKTLQQIQGKQKTSALGGGFLPEDKVNFQKQKQLIKIAEDWLSEKKIPLESKWQIDIISIEVNLSSKKAKIRHLKNAISS